MSFVHLHCHTEYSLLKGACRLKQLVAAVKRIGQKAIAITDCSNMFGAVKFFCECEKVGVKPIIGCELAVNCCGSFNFNGGLDLNKGFSLIVLCENQTGYENLVKLVSFNNCGSVHGSGSCSLINFDLLSKHKRGLIALSGGFSGEVAQAFFYLGSDVAKNVVKSYCEIFGKQNFFLELQNQGLTNQRELNLFLSETAKEMNIELVATNNVHYVEKCEAKTQKILTCIKYSKTLKDSTVTHLPNDEFFLKTEDEMKDLFENFGRAVENTVKIANRCSFKFGFRTIHLPRFNSSNFNVNRNLLVNKAKKGLFIRYGKNPDDTVLKRFYHELNVVETMGFVDYFLIVQDYVNYAKTVGIKVGPGRGSAAGSLIAFCLNITAIDPLKYGLSFERFLNPNRKKMPDFDVDFCNERRQEVLDYVFKKYGEKHVAQIVTFGTLSAKAAVRCVAKVLGFDLSFSAKIANLIPSKFKLSLNEALNQSVNLKKLILNDEKANLVFENAKLVEGFLKNTSTHAAAIVLSNESLDSYVPVIKHEKVVLSQYDMEDIAKLGFLKMDFLGLRNLTLIGKCENLIKKIQPNFNIEKISLDDQKTFQLLCGGETVGVFQLESKLTREILIKIKPTKLSDLMIILSLNRPGPSQFIDSFIRNRRNSKKIKNINDKLSLILKETNGVIVYQEQVMQIFHEIAGYSFSRIDLIRKAISEKNLELIEQERDVFLFGLKNLNGEFESVGAVNLGLKREVAERIFDKLTKFSAYAFNKSHAAAYSLIAYETAFLKANFTVFYMVCLLNSVLFLKGYDKLKLYLSECEKFKIHFLPLNVNSSGVVFEVVGLNKIAFSFLAVKGVGRNLAEQIVEERQNGKFSSLDDFINRLRGGNISKTVLEILIEKGAFNGVSSELELKKFKNNVKSVVLNKTSRNEVQLNLFGVLENENKHENEFEIIAEVRSKKLFSSEKFSRKMVLLKLFSNFRMVKCWVSLSLINGLCFDIYLQNFYVFICVKSNKHGKTIILVTKIRQLSEFNESELVLVINLSFNYDYDKLNELICLMKKNVGESDVVFVFNKNKKFFRRNNVPKVKLNFEFLNKINQILGENSFKIVKKTY